MSFIGGKKQIAYLDAFTKKEVLKLLEGAGKNGLPEAGMFTVPLIDDQAVGYSGQTTPFVFDTDKPAAAGMNKPIRLDNTFYPVRLSVTGNGFVGAALFYFTPNMPSAAFLSDEVAFFVGLMFAVEEDNPDRSYLAVVGFSEEGHIYQTFSVPVLSASLVGLEFVGEDLYLHLPAGSKSADTEDAVVGKVHLGKISGTKNAAAVATCQDFSDGLTTDAKRVLIDFNPEDKTPHYPLESGVTVWEFEDTPDVYFGVTDKADIKHSKTFTVGPQGDYRSLNEALDHLSRLTPVYSKWNIAVTLELQAGYVMAEQVLVRGIDLGWITITGVNAVTIVDNTALTINFTSNDYDFDSFPVFGVSKGGTLPRVGQLFEFDVAGVGGSKDGVIAIGAGSSADVLAGYGFVNAGRHGILATRGATINAQGANVSGAGEHGIYAANGSSINAQVADASGAGERGIYALNASTISAREADASGAGQHGVVAENGSTINARNVNASGAGQRGISAENAATINAQGANASGAGGNGIFAGSGSSINAQVADASGAGQIGIYAISGATINAQVANASGAVGAGISAISAATINAQGANASGAGGNGISAGSGSSINARVANARKGAVDSSSDITAGFGSTIVANGATGGTSIAVNTLTASGIIFK